MKHQASSIKPRVVFIDDDADARELLRAFFRPRGYDMRFFDRPSLALQELEKTLDQTDVIVTDYMLPEYDGVELIRRLRKQDIQIPIILMTAHSSIEMAVEALEEGASDFLIKPLHLPQLELCIERAFRIHELHQENTTLRMALQQGGQDDSSMEGIVGRSAKIKQAFELARRVAGSSASVLITGETGTGKEVIARAIHRFCENRKGPFVAINCSAIPENLLEGELFGYVKGAFTGAAGNKAGLFEEAEGGTLFLDEIGDLPLSLQAKLLRVLQERQIKRLGENKFRDIDVRILSATHKNLPREVAEGRFREDLYFRLNVIPIHIPSLRERSEDILPLADAMLKKFMQLHGTPAKTFSKETLEFFLSHSWPGNVRELENTVERAVLLCEGDVIQMSHLLLGAASQMSGSLPVESHGEAGGHGSSAEAEEVRSALDEVLSLEELTRRHILRVLRRNNGAKDKTARMLGIDRKTLYRKLNEYEALIGRPPLPPERSERPEFVQ
ncbi:MAG: sigma-54-dependent Fis family transcriptional regulator [Bdellovibrionaceae bacterium]|nr:sigma-54-dependent Fis family transcriptional regulator [Pseudobdellovibrionaceae bacterium]